MAEKKLSCLQASASFSKTFERWVNKCSKFAIRIVKIFLFILLWIVATLKKITILIVCKVERKII